MMEELEKYISEYKSCAEAHGKAIAEGDSVQANVNHDIIIKLVQRIKRFGKDGDIALFSLTNEENSSVRCWAATHSLKYDERKAKKVLKNLAKGKDIIAFDAEMVLKEWKKGNLKLLYLEE